MSKKPFLLLNDKPIASWLLAAGLAIAAATFMYLEFFAEAHSTGMSETKIVALGLLFFSLFLVPTLLAQPRAEIVISEGEVVLREHRLWGTKAQRFPTSSIRGMTILKEDTDGGDYFKCVFIAPSGRTICIYESYHREKVEAAFKALAAALKPPPKPENQENLGITPAG